MYFEAGAPGFEWDRKPLWEGPMEGFGSLPEDLTPGRVPPGVYLPPVVGATR
jgi:hypothetical protein